MDLAASWAQPDAEMIARVLDAMARRQAVEIEYAAKQRTLLGMFSPHRLVRTAFRIHVRGAVREFGGGPVRYLDLVLNRFIRVGAASGNDYVTDREDLDWHTMETVRLFRRTDLDVYFLRSLEFEHGRDKFVSMQVRRALRRYLVQGYVRRTYGDEREQVWGEEADEELI